MVLEGLPNILKIKIWRYNLRIEKDEDIFDSSFMGYMPELEAKLSEADTKYEEHVKKIHRDYGIEISEEYVWTLPEPAILTISKQDIVKVPKRILSRLVENFIIIRHNNRLYKLVLEYPCG